MNYAPPSTPGTDGAGHRLGAVELPPGHRTGRRCAGSLSVTRRETEGSANAQAPGRATWRLHGRPPRRDGLDDLPLDRRHQGLHRRLGVRSTRSSSAASWPRGSSRRWAVRPSREDQASIDWMNGTPKVVISNSLTESPWKNATVAGGDLAKTVGGSRTRRAATSSSTAGRRWSAASSPPAWWTRSTCSSTPAPSARTAGIRRHRRQPAVQPGRRPAVRVRGSRPCTTHPRVIEALLGVFRLY